MTTNRAVFLDRDGTINRDVPYCSRPEDFELLRGVARGIAYLNQHFKVVVVTNQSGVARGYFTDEILDRIHHHMLQELSREGGRVDAIYYCPHHPQDNCEWWTPSTTAPTTPRTTVSAVNPSPASSWPPPGRWTLTSPAPTLWGTSSRM
ncbi:MAG: HAD-IIIA family hydrolase [Dehalococcoidia bacterium]